MPDQTIKCKDCGNDFVHDEKEQAFFLEKQYANAPKRCVQCRKQRRREADGRERADKGE